MHTNVQEEPLAIATPKCATEADQIASLFSDALDAIMQRGDHELLTRMSTLLKSHVTRVDAIIKHASEDASPGITKAEDNSSEGICALDAELPKHSPDVSDAEDGFAEHSASRRTVERLVRTSKAIGALGSDARSVSVTISGTGKGVHTRWHYGDATASPTAATAGVSCPSSPSIAPNVLQLEKEEPSPPPTPSRRRLRAEENPIPSRPSKPQPTQDPSYPSSPRFFPRTPIVPSTRSCNPPPSPPPVSVRPFNHYPPLPPRSRGLRRESAFYHKSHFEIGWVPEFGKRDAPPTTYEDALPPWVNSKARVPTAPPPTPAVSPGPSAPVQSRGPDLPIQTPAKLRSPPPSVGRSFPKRGRDCDGDDDTQERSPRRARHQTPS